MGQILKLSDGDKVLARKKEKSDLKSLQAELEQAYSGITDETLKQLVDALTANEQAFLEAKRLSSLDERKFKTEMAKKKLALIKGEAAYNATQTGTASTNYFGYVKGDGISNLANELTRKTLTPQEQTTALTTSTPTSTGSTHFIYNWRNPQFDYMQSSATVKDRVKLVAEGLINQINLMNSVRGKDGIIHNFDSNNYDYASGAVAQLLGILDKLNNADYTDDQAFQDLTNIVGSGKLGVDSDEYKQIFSEYWREKTAAEKADIKDITGDYSGNAKLDKELKRAGYKIYEKDGIKYIGDANGNRVTDYTWNYINDDYTLGDEGGYNQGAFILNDGSFWTGDVRTLRDPDDPFYRAYKTYIDKNNPNGIYAYNDNLYYEGALDDDSYTKDDLLAAVQAQVGTGNWLDVSNYLEGDAPVIAVRTDGKAFLKTPYGTPIFLNDPNVKLYTLDESGNLVEYGDTSSYRYRGYGEDLTDRSVIQLDGSWKDEKELPFTAHDHIGNKNGWSQMWDSFKDEGDSSKRIEEHPEEFIKEVLSAIYQLRVTNNQAGLTERQRKILHNHGLDGQTNTAEFARSAAAVLLIINGFKTNPAVAEYLKTPEARSALMLLKIAYNNSKNLNTQVYRHGGVIYAKKGTVVSGQQVKEDEASAFDIMAQNEAEGAQHGYSDSSRWSVGNQELKDMMKAEDWIRIGAIAADLVGIGANFVPVYGSAISGATGVGSAAANLTADIMDESVDGLQVMKNLGINLGLAALNLVPGAGAGAKTASLLGKVSKWAPRILKIANYAGLVLDQDTHKAWEKVLTGDFDKITRDDLKNIGWTMSTLAGAARSTRRTAIVNQGRKEGTSIKQIAKQTPKGEKYYEITSTDGKKYNVSKNVADQVQALAKEGKVEEANKLLQGIPEIGKSVEFGAMEEGKRNKAFRVLGNIKEKAKARRKGVTSEKPVEEPEAKKYFFPMKEKQEMGYNEGAVRSFLNAQRVDKSGNPRRFMTDAERYMLQELGVNSGARIRGNSVEMFDNKVAAMKPATVLDIPAQTPTPTPASTPAPASTSSSTPTPKSTPKSPFTSEELELLKQKASTSSKYTLDQEINNMLYELKKNKSIGKVKSTEFKKAILMERTKGKSFEDIQKMVNNPTEFAKLRAEYKFKQGGSLQRLYNFVNY